MLAEKTALLSGQDVDDVAQEGPQTPTNEHGHSTLALTSPGDATTTNPLDTATTSPPAFSPTKPMSEKARGKMRATESTTSIPMINGESEEPDEELLKVAQAGVGPNGYVPTQEWISSWQKG